MKINDCSVAFAIVISLLSGCATQIQQNKINASSNNFKNGDMRAAAIATEDAFRTKNALYYAEIGQIDRLIGNSKIVDSTKNLLKADQYVQRWEIETSSKINRSLSDVGSFLLAEGLGGDYDLKNFEMSYLSQSIAINHLIQGNWEYAMVEAKKMAQREKVIEALLQSRTSALAKKKNEQGNSPQGRFAKDSVSDINGYPVSLLDDYEVTGLKNAYQNPASYYLSAFVHESQNEPSLAAPGYRLAIELRPDIAFFQESLGNLDGNIANNKSRGGADTLFVFDTGFMPRVDPFKVTFPINIGSGLKVFTLTFPVIQRATETFYPSQVQVGGQPINFAMVANLDAMARRNLKDEMPSYVLRATTRAITSLVAQTAAQKAAAKQGNNNNAVFAGLFVAVALQAINVADVRHWSTMPSHTYLARATLPSGMKEFKLMTPAGIPVSQSITLVDGYNVVYVRVFRNKATVLTSNDFIASTQKQSVNTTSGMSYTIAKSPVGN